MSRDLTAISSRASALRRGRPGRGRDFQRQDSFHAARCQRTTISGGPRPGDGASSGRADGQGPTAACRGRAARRGPPRGAGRGTRACPEDARSGTRAAFCPPTSTLTAALVARAGPVSRPAPCLLPGCGLACSGPDPVSAHCGLLQDLHAIDDCTTSRWLAKVDCALCAALGIGVLSEATQPISAGPDFGVRRVHSGL